MDDLLVSDERLSKLARLVVSQYEAGRCLSYLRLHGWGHTLRVIRNVLAIVDSMRKDFSPITVIAAAITHDIGYLRNASDHVRESALMAESILISCGFSSEEMREIAETILAHSPKVKLPRTLHERILYVADKCDMIGLDGTMRCIMEIGHNFNNPDDLAQSLLVKGDELVGDLYGAGIGKRLINRKWRETRDFLRTILSRGPYAKEYTQD